MENNNILTTLIGFISTGALATTITAIVTSRNTAKKNSAEVRAENKKTDIEATSASINVVQQVLDMTVSRLEKCEAENAQLRAQVWDLQQQVIKLGGDIDVPTGKKSQAGL